MHVSAKKHFFVRTMRLGGFSSPTTRTTQQESILISITVSICRLFKRGETVQMLLWLEGN